MEKVFGMLGMAIVAMMIKMRNIAESVLEFFHGEDGFFMMVGICGVVLLAAIIMLSWTSRRRRKAA